VFSHVASKRKMGCTNSRLSEDKNQARIRHRPFEETAVVHSKTIDGSRASSIHDPDVVLDRRMARFPNAKCESRGNQSEALSKEVWSKLLLARRPAMAEKGAGKSLPDGDLKTRVTTGLRKAGVSTKSRHQRKIREIGGSKTCLFD